MFKGGILSDIGGGSVGLAGEGGGRADLKAIKGTGAWLDFIIGAVVDGVKGSATSISFFSLKYIK